jgi:NAD(P)-dependent dehydrogenase (short-subunit alcohol dehydrogenase family)
MTKTWLITGAGRGMGVEFARAALAAGHKVVATGRNPDTVRSALGGHENLLVTALDVTDAHSSGLVISISSGAGVIGSASGSAYAASKFALEGWMESLAGEVQPFGIGTMIVEPGFFRTELLTPESTTFGELSIDDYDEARAEINAFWASMNGTQAGDPAKLAEALVQLADSDEPPLRWAAGEDVVGGVEDKARLLLAQVDAHRELSVSLAHEDAQVAAR